ncbi:hypothetical protein ACFVTP_00480 [Streptomyces celluloflavus]|uniref:hypothetical protein n=1 Tax=Streptomyces celluloflavus TaxID=58344 RepID=UPI0036D97D94
MASPEMYTAPGIVPLDLSGVAVGDDIAGYVDAGGILAFLPAVTEQHRSDVLHSVLFAQRRADRECARFGNPRQWLVAYRRALDEMGWNASPLGAPGPVSGAGPLDHVLLEALQSAEVPDDQRAALGGALAAEMALPDNAPAAEIFEGASHKRKNALFQVATVTEHEGRVVMNGGIFWLTADYFAHLLQLDVAASHSLTAAVGPMRLNDVVYAQVRDRVMEKLARG